MISGKQGDIAVHMNKKLPLEICSVSVVCNGFHKGNGTRQKISFNLDTSKIQYQGSGYVTLSDYSFYLMPLLQGDLAVYDCLQTALQSYHEALMGHIM